MASSELLHLATHPQRHRLLQRLAHGPRTVSELVRSLGLRQSLVSHHLRLLRRARLVAVQRFGRVRRYALDERALEGAAAAYLESLLGRAEPRALDPRPRVLFVCVHNAGRSQMALAFFERLAGGGAVGDCAGSQPAAEIHPLVAEAMAELGYELTRRPQRITETMVRDADLVIDLGCGDAIPEVPGVRRLAWEAPDPGGQPLPAVRRIRDSLRLRVQALVGELLPAQPGPSSQATRA